MMPTLEELLAIKQQVEQHYIDQPGVTGIDVGYKEVGGELTDQIAVRVHVARKTDDVPADQRVPEEIHGAVTDVVERVYELHAVSVPERSLLADSKHYSPLLGGVSMGPSRAVGNSIFAGTLGAVVIDNETQARVALTNFHVAAVDATGQVGDRMVQPSRIEHGKVPQDEFGATLRLVLSDHVDGAVVSIDEDRQTSCDIAEIGSVLGTRTATLGTAVRKRGRTTELTRGSVDGISATVQVDYGPGLGVRTLRDQVSITAATSPDAVFSDHGDSGSVIVDEDGFVVALLFAGAGANTVGNPIASVLQELNVSMCTGGPDGHH
ncbi:hypothetical protein ACH4S8_31705 [Streptomyces sp. NPDC021080]|uniref:hypothetical protein n=1 Tax=Streptomyces sp. NPDC021080 TaxID=3365110 RepID=UPI0037AC8AF3